MNSIDYKIFDPHRLIIIFSDKIDLVVDDSEKICLEVIYMLLYQILAYSIHAKIKKSHKNNKVKILAPKWNEESQLLDGYLEYIIRKSETFTDNRI